jgi:hypothetical protein
LSLKELKMEVIVANKEVILVFLLALSELLALVPQVQANSVFQLVFSGLKKIKEMMSK